MFAVVGVVVATVEMAGRGLRHPASYSGFTRSSIDFSKRHKLKLFLKYSHENKNIKNKDLLNGHVIPR